MMNLLSKGIVATVVVVVAIIVLAVLVVVYRKPIFGAFKFFVQQIKRLFITSVKTVKTANKELNN